MSDRKLFILGTACLVPTASRNHNGYFLRWNEEGFLFDPGEGTQRQLILAGVSASQITKIFISHFHGDHCLGLPGIIQRLSLDRVNHTVQIYYPASGQKYYDRLKEASISHFKVELEEFPVRESGIVFENLKYYVEAKKLNHTVDSFAYRIQERDGRTLIPEKLSRAGIKGVVTGELIRNGEITIGGKVTRLDEVSQKRSGQSFVFMLDTRMDETLLHLAKDADMLVCDSTYLSDRENMAKEYGHLTAKQAGIIAKESNVRKLVLTHFSQIYSNVKEFENEAKSVFENVVAVKDGDIVSMPKRKRYMK